MESDTTIEEIVGNVIVNGAQVNRNIVHYMDDLFTILLDGNMFIKDELIYLRPNEYNILKALTRRPRKSWKKAELLKNVWEVGNGSETSLQWSISALRKIIKDYHQNPKAIETIPNEGFQYNPQGEMKVQPDPQHDPSKPLYQDGYMGIYDNFNVKINGNQTKLGHLEYRLLTTLASSPDKVWGRAELLEKVWGIDKGTEGSLKAYIMKLRKIIEKDRKNPNVIMNHERVGYSFQSQGGMRINDYAPKPGPN